MMSVTAHGGLDDIPVAPVAYQVILGLFRSSIFCIVLFGSIALFSLHARGSSLRQHSRQQARSSVLTITVRFVRCRQPNRCSL